MQPGGTLNALDPRIPIILDVQELGRRAGAMQEKELTAAAPADLGSEVIKIAEGSDLQLNIRLESVVEGVLVSGDVTAEATGECARCLKDIAWLLTVDFQELYEYEDNEDLDEDAFKLEGDLLDLEPVLRDSLVLSLPLAPHCDTECRGLCGTCGTDLNEYPEHQHDVVDSRWQGLTALLEDDKKEG